LYPWGFAWKLGHVEGSIYFLEIMWSSLKEPMCIVDAKGENVLMAFNNSRLLHLGGITMFIKET
jgi:hypothetical protein